MISTRDLSGLPDLRGFRRLTRALAMLDAVMSPEWEYRYYSFNSHWADGEMMASMRNGSGDRWFALLCSAGVALHGLAHEAPIFRPGTPWPGIFESLPAEFHDNLLREPAFTTEDSTFCIWRRSTDAQWSCGPVQLPLVHDPDGSEALLSQFWPARSNIMWNSPAITTKLRLRQETSRRFTGMIHSPTRRFAARTPAWTSNL